MLKSKKKALLRPFFKIESNSPFLNRVEECFQESFLLWLFFNSSFKTSNPQKEKLHLMKSSKNKNASAINPSGPPTPIKRVTPKSVKLRSCIFYLASECLILATQRIDDLAYNYPPQAVDRPSAGKRAMIYVRKTAAAASN